MTMIRTAAGLLPLALMLGCGATTKSGGTLAPPEAASTRKAPKDLVGPPPTGFDKPVEVTPRGTGDIFEQINGGSASYLENGMVDAVFATYPKTGGEESHAIEFEVYRFDSATGARVQFETLHGKAGEGWRGDSHAVQHDYGIELYKGRYVVRITFNDGPGALMKVGARVLANHVVSRIPAK